VSGLSLHAPASEAAKNTASPASRNGLRPNLSLSDPAANTSAANARLKASTIQRRSRVDASSSMTRVGSAMFTIVVDTFTTKTAAHRATSASAFLERLTACRPMLS
jgi:hypothetical protein